MQGFIYQRLTIRAKSELIVDLEEEANKNVKFYLVANKKKHLYGEPNSTLRKSITNRRFRLIRLKKVNPVLANRYLAGEEDLAGEEVDIEEEEDQKRWMSRNKTKTTFKPFRPVPTQPCAIIVIILWDPLLVRSWDSPPLVCPQECPQHHLLCLLLCLLSPLQWQNL
jgi:hypothetical protein